MRPERFTEQAQEVLSSASQIAYGLKNSQVDVEHVLLAMVNQRGGGVSELLRNLGVDIAAVKSRVESVVAAFPKVSHQTGSHGAIQLYPTPRYTRLLDIAEREANRLNDEFISVEHLLIAIHSENTGEASTILKEFSVDKEKIYLAMQNVRGGHRVDSPTAESKYRSLEKYGRDLPELARQGKLDPVIGRDEEIKRVIQVLSRRTKNNPALIGDPGVGK